MRNVCVDRGEICLARDLDRLTLPAETYDRIPSLRGSDR